MSDISIRGHRPAGETLMECRDLACRNNNMEMGGPDTPEYWELHTLSKH